MPRFLSAFRAQLLAASVLAALLAVPALAQRVAIEPSVPERICATPEPTEAEARAAYEAVLDWLQRPGPRIGADTVFIPIAFHVIYAGSQGNIPDQWVVDQIDVLNDAFAPMGYQFFLASLDRTDNADWYFGLGGNTPEELQMKQALNRDVSRFLNIYTADLVGGVLGWAYIPFSGSESFVRDGVVLLDQSLPGGNLSPYNLGDTGTHEVGHYVGLYHTFREGCLDEDTEASPSCAFRGDQVCDTPAEASPAGGCPIGRDTCPTGGVDPIHNFMDYTFDSCMYEFTPGQITRAVALMNQFRPTISDETGAFTSPEEVDFANAFIGIPDTLEALVVNLSDDTLSVTSITSDNPRFTASAPTLAVAPNSALTFSIIFTADGEDPQNGTLSIATDNVAVGTLTVEVTGNALEPQPIAAVSPVALTASSALNTTTTDTLQITNVGPGTLDYSFESLPDWITDVDPDTLQVAPDEEQEAIFTFDASGLTAGVYQDLVEFTSNDTTLGDVTLHAVFAVGGVLPPPALLSPLYRAENVPTDAALVWTAVENATGYEVQIAPDEAFSVVAASGSSDTPSITLAVDAGTEFFWRVRSLDGSNPESDWSLPFRFTTASTTAAAPEPTRRSTLLTLGAPYPNPASSTVTVPFTLAQPAAVSVRVFDVTGRLVATLANGAAYSTGAHTVELAAGALPAGTYLVRIESGGEAESAPLTLVR